jgi:hypothetical protein
MTGPPYNKELPMLENDYPVHSSPETAKSELMLFLTHQTVYGTCPTVKTDSHFTILSKNDILNI